MRTRNIFFVILIISSVVSVIYSVYHIVTLFTSESEHIIITGITARHVIVAEKFDYEPDYIANNIRLLSQTKEDFSTVSITVDDNRRIIKIFCITEDGRTYFAEKKILDYSEKIFNLSQIKSVFSTLNKEGGLKIKMILNKSWEMLMLWLLITVIVCGVIFILIKEKERK